MKDYAKLFGKKAQAHRAIAQLHKAKADDINTGRGDLNFHKALAEQHEALASAEEQHQELCRNGSSDKVAKSTFGDDLIFDQNFNADAYELADVGCGL